MAGQEWRGQDWFGLVWTGTDGTGRKGEEQNGRDRSRKVWRGLAVAEWNRLDGIGADRI